MLGRNLLSLLAALALLFTACSADEGAPDPEGEGIAIGDEDPELGKALFEPAAEADAKEDSLYGAAGLPKSADTSATQVWEVRNDWTDTDTSEARKAGLAWEADSGLSWNQKYALWIRSMKKIASVSYFQTYELTTPYGRSLPAPAVECAETSIFLRATFASWYHLPFFLEANDERGKRLYLGHFGFRTADGKYGNTPDFKNVYKDYSHLADRWQAEGWPTDSRLRGRKLGGSQDDFQPFLGDDVHAGAYFDEIFLNKRVGYFMIYALSYFGSMNLADPKNTYNIKPEAVREGDSLLERWQRRGIGHTLVVKNVEQHAPDAFEVELVSGSMPRRQGKWESGSASKSYFTNHYCGGSDTDYEGVPYAKYGGGLKRWRVATLSNGRWNNRVDPADGDVFVNANDLDAVGARPDRFEQILREVPPEEKREVLLAQISDNRQHLRQYPASCSARIRREEAFDKLYDLESESFSRTRAQTDAEHRKLEDYVLAELEYDRSKTCCWNSSTTAMFEIIMAKARKDTEDHSSLTCKAPTVFMNQDGGYRAFADFAAEIGRAGDWVLWSEDEPCAQRGVANDTQAEHEWTPWCEAGEAVLANTEG